MKKIGNLIAPLMIGDQGEAAVIAYDSRIRTLQDFTSDPDKITKAGQEDLPGSTVEPHDRRGGGRHAHAAHRARRTGGGSSD